MLVYVAFGVAVLALLVAVAAFIRATGVMENTDIRFTKAQELFNKQREEDSRLNAKIDRSQSSLRKSLSDFRGEVRRALAEPEPEPQEEVPAEPAPEEKPKRRKRKARLNLFERIAADDDTDEETK